jgi:hypothetical protein
VVLSRRAARGARAPCRVGTQPTRHGRTASKTVRDTGRVAGRGGGVAREPLFGLPGLRRHLLVGRAVAFVGGLVPGIGEVVRSSAARSRASGLTGRRQGPLRAGQPGLGRVQRRLRLPGLRLSRRHPGVVLGKAGDPLTLGLLDNLVGEVGHRPRGCLPGPGRRVDWRASSDCWCVQLPAWPCGRHRTQP